MSRLGPVMSSIAIFFHAVVEFESPDHVVVHVVPALKLSPGAGVRGVTSARTSRGEAARARRAAKACAENIVLIILPKNDVQKIVMRWLESLAKNVDKNNGVNVNPGPVKKG